MKILYRSNRARGEAWKAWLAEYEPDITFTFWEEETFPSDAEFLVLWEVSEDLLEKCPNAKVIFSVGAGADQFDIRNIPANIPVVRMIEPGLTQGMVEYVMGATLALHREIPRYLTQQKKHIWQAHNSLLASQRHVGVMGIGQLGKAVLLALRDFGFQCSGWSRSPHHLLGVECWHGEKQLPEFLAQCEILICLLPLTDATRGILNARLFASLPEGASLIHVGRGEHLVSDDLIAALKTKHLSNAIIDVASPEPIPENSPLWNCENLWITPHVASETRNESAVSALLTNIRRYENGNELFGEIDRQKGY